jgi:hypothetical protein
LIIFAHKLKIVMMKRKMLFGFMALIISLSVQAQTTLKKVYNEDINPLEQIDQAVVKAKAIIRSYSYMTLTDYAVATGQSKSAASRDLKQIVADPDSGIMTRGEHSHKIWVERK